MARGSKEPSEIFLDVLDQARQELALSSAGAAAFGHRGVRGAEREGALARFFGEHLPGDYGVGTGEVIDFTDRRTGQLDIIIYDKNTSAPIHTGTQSLLLPCEAVYAIIEVKTRLTLKEIDTAYRAARKVRTLRPFKRAFVGSRSGGAAAASGTHRCQYLVFAYETDLGSDGWANKEFARAKAAAQSAGADLDVVDRLFVLNRGPINLADSSGKVIGDDEGNVFLEFYLHVMNFLNREKKRRDAVDWQIYGPDTASGWSRLH